MVKEKLELLSKSTSIGWFYSRDNLIKVIKDGAYLTNIFTAKLELIALQFMLKVILGHILIVLLLNIFLSMNFIMQQQID